MSKKLNIKPVHLAIIGLAIIVLGILIPSFFISPFSTIGFSVIIGSVILLSAYAFFAVNVVKSKGKKTIKWLVLPVILGLLVGGGFFANNKYQDYLNNKIYAVNESIDLSDFTLIVSSLTYTAPQLNEPQEKIAASGDINTPENCSRYNFLNLPPSLDLNDKTTWVDENDWEKAHPSGKYCEWRNDSRKKIQAYTADNKHMSVDYKIVASSTVDTKDIQVTVMLDTGRDIKKPISQFDYDALMSTNYTPAFNYTYKPYSETQLGDNINKGITRSQNVSFDVLNSEKIIDLKVTYKGETRLIRITR